MSIRFGFLSTIDNPLLPRQILAARQHGVKHIAVICDATTISGKDKKIWKDRTGGYFERKTSSNPRLHELTQLKIPFYFVKNHNDHNCLSLISDLGIGCLYNAGTPRKLSKTLLSSIDYGVLNVHPGILPHYRGSCAVEWAIYNDDKIGNTAHFMSVDFDDGPVIAVDVLKIPKGIDYHGVRNRIHISGCNLAAATLYKVQKDRLKPKDALAQDIKVAKYWPPMPANLLKEVKKKIKEQTYKHLENQAPEY